MFAARRPAPAHRHVAPWLALPELEPPLVLKPRFGSWGRDVIRCDDGRGDRARRSTSSADEPWFEATGAVAQKLVAPRGYRPAPRRRAAAASSARSGASRRPANGGRTSRSARGASRSTPPPEACAIALAAAAAVGGDLVGVDLLPAGRRHVGRARGERRRRLQRARTRSATTSSPPPRPRSRRARGVSTCRTRGLTCGRAAPPARTGAAAGTARTSGCRARRAAPP